MSVLQEYEEMISELGYEKFNMIQKYLEKVSPIEKYDLYNKELRSSIDLPYNDFIKKEKELRKKYGVILLSDVLYKNDEWKKYDRWYNESYKKRKAEIIDVYVSSFDDIRFNAIIYLNNKKLGKVTGCCIKSLWEEEINNKDKFKDLVYCDFDKFCNLPKINKCSKLLQEIYDFVCDSESSICHITEEDWQELYADKYTEKDIDRLKDEVKQYDLEEIITFGEDGYKILAYGNLEISFIDNRNIDRNKDYER